MGATMQLVELIVTAVNKNIILLKLNFFNEIKRNYF